MLLSPVLIINPMSCYNCAEAGLYFTQKKPDPAETISSVQLKRISNYIFFSLHKQRLFKTDMRLHWDWCFVETPNKWLTGKEIDICNVFLFYFSTSLLHESTGFYSRGSLWGCKRRRNYHDLFLQPSQTDLQHTHPQMGSLPQQSWRKCGENSAYCTYIILLS